MISIQITSGQQCGVIGKVIVRGSDERGKKTINMEHTGGHLKVVFQSVQFHKKCSIKA